MHFISCIHSFSHAPLDGNLVPVLTFRKYTLMNTSTTFYYVDIFTVYTTYKRYDRAIFTLSRRRKNRINIIKINRKTGRRTRFVALIWATHNIVIFVTRNRIVTCAYVIYRGSVKLARHSINTKKMIIVPVALFIVL